jgi:hypothetical protein
VSIPSEKTDLHVWGEFRWTIPFPWPIPDLVRVVYRMDLRSTFVWIEALNAVNALERSASAWATWPYHISEDPWLQLEFPTEGRVSLEASTTVWVFPEIGVTSYPIRLWIDFRAAGWYSVGGENFHHWWVEQL